MPYEEALVLIGEIGLIALILEAGIELDVAQLRQTGTRAMAIAFTGSLLPVAVGTGFAIATGKSLKAALAIGAAFAPTSLGVAASALNGGNMVNTSVGQLIIASCVIDDIIGLVLLSMFQVLVKPDPQIIEYFIPLISSFGFLLLLGIPAVTFLPRLIEKKYLTLFPKKMRSMAMFGLLTAMCMAYLPLMNYTKSSYLTGAFLAGATFSQVDGAYDKFMHSSHHVMQWLLRVFFAASIGFQVPLREFKSPHVIGMGFAFWGTCVAVKSLVAIFVPNFEQAEKGAIYNPYYRDLLVTGLSMTCRGEFSFIISAFALDKGVIDEKVYASIVFAVLLSAVTSPFMLLQCIKYFDGLKIKQLKATDPRGEGGDGTMPLHFHISLQTGNAWNLLETLQNEVNGLDIVIVDLRTTHSRGINATIRNDIYVRDEKQRISIQTLKIETANTKAIHRVGSSSQLLKKLSSGNLQELDDEEDREAADIVMKKVSEEEMIEAREREIQKTLYSKLQYLNISELDVEEWNPWDWSVALDTLILKQGNGKPADLEFFMDLFNMADADDSGNVDGDELLQVLLKAGMNVTKDGIEAMIAHVDEDEDGEISKEEWETSVSHYLEKKKNNHRIDIRTLIANSSRDLAVSDGSGNNSDTNSSEEITSFPITEKQVEVNFGMEL